MQVEINIGFKYQNRHYLANAMTIWRDWTKLQDANKVEPYQIDAHIWLHNKLHLNSIRFCNIYNYLMKIKVGTHGCWGASFR
jgi:hypothetical protein